MKIRQNACAALLQSLDREMLNGPDMWSCMEEGQSYETSQLESKSFNWPRNTYSDMFMEKGKEG